jgi:hypothetical protein
MELRRCTSLFRNSLSLLISSTRRASEPTDPRVMKSFFCFNAFDDGAGLVVQTVELLLVHGRVRRVWCFKGSNFY